VDGITVQPVGRVVGGRVEAFDDDWNTEEAVIRLDENHLGPAEPAGRLPLPRAYY